MVFTCDIGGSHSEVTRYSSEEISGNESNEVMKMTEMERQADFNRHKEEMKKKRRKKKRTSSSLQSSTFQGKSSESTGTSKSLLYISTGKLNAKNCFYFSGRAL